jgi:uncharacterized protein
VSNTAELKLVTPGQRIRQVPWKPLDAIVVFLLPWVVLPVAILLFLLAIGQYLPVANDYLKALDSSSPEASFVLVILDAISSFAIIGYYLRKRGANWSDLGLRKFKVGKAILFIVLTYVIFFVGILAIYALIQAFLPSFNPDQAQSNEFTNAAPAFRLISLLALVVIPPLVEEPVFRGFIFPAFSKRYGLVAGALISSLLFGFAHLQANVSVYTFVIGLLLCFMYTRLNSIIPGIVLHMLNNYLAFSALNHN